MLGCIRSYFGLKRPIPDHRSGSDVSRPFWCHNQIFYVGIRPFFTKEVSTKGTRRNSQTEISPQRSQKRLIMKMKNKSLVVNKLLFWLDISQSFWCWFHRPVLTVFLAPDSFGNLLFVRYILGLPDVYLGWYCPLMLWQESNFIVLLALTRWLLRFASSFLCLFYRLFNLSFKVFLDNWRSGASSQESVVNAASLWSYFGPLWTALTLLGRDIIRSVANGCFLRR